MLNTILNYLELIGGLIVMLFVLVLAGIAIFFALIAETIGVDTTNFWESEPETMFQWLVADVTEDVNILDVMSQDEWMEPGIEVHFSSSAETIDKIIANREMELVSKEQFISSGYRCSGGSEYEISKWKEPPKEITYYKACKGSPTEGGYYSQLQHNQIKNEAFHTYSSF